MFSLIINILLWSVVSVALGSELSGDQDLIRDNDFLLSSEDMILSLWLGGCLAIFLWQRLSMLFFDTWEILGMSPVQVWCTKNLAIWFYYVVGIVLFPPLILLPGLPLMWLIEKLQIHLGDYVLLLVAPLFRLSS